MKFSRSDIEKLVTITHASEDEKDLYGTCPYCGHNEWGISLVKENNPFNCYRKSKCGVEGNIFTLLSFLGKTKDFINERIITDQLVSFDNQQQKQPLDLFLPTTTPPPGWKRIMNDDYLQSRKVTQFQFEKYLIGQSIIRKDYVTVLVQMNGDIVGYLSRSKKSKQEIDSINEKRKLTGERKYLRYDNSHSDFAKMLFGYDDIVVGQTTDVILVEGWLSKTNTDTNLELDFDQSNWLKCVGTFGAKVSDEQVELLKLKGVKKIWLWFEADVLDKVKKVSAKLSTHFEVVVGYLKGKDPNDMNVDEMIQLMDNCVSPIEFDMNYI